MGKCSAFWVNSEDLGAALRLCCAGRPGAKLRDNWPVKWGRRKPPGRAERSRRFRALIMSAGISGEAGAVAASCLIRKLGISKQLASWTLSSSNHRDNTAVSSISRAKLSTVSSGYFVAIMQMFCSADVAAPYLGLDFHGI